MTATTENSKVYRDSAKLSTVVLDSDWIYSPANPENDRQMMYMDDLEAVLEDFYPNTVPEVGSNDAISETIFAEKDEVEFAFDEGSEVRNSTIAERNEIDSHSDGEEEPMDISDDETDAENNDLNNNIFSTCPRFIISDAISDAASKENTKETLYNEHEPPSKRPRLSQIINLNDTITNVPTKKTTAADLFPLASVHPGEQFSQMAVPRFNCSTLPDPFISASSINSVCPAVVSGLELRRDSTTTSILDWRNLCLPKRPDVSFPGSTIVDRQLLYSRDRLNARDHNQRPQNASQSLNGPRKQMTVGGFTGGSHVNNNLRRLDGFGAPSPGVSTPYATNVSCYNAMSSMNGFRTISPSRDGTYETSVNTCSGALPTNSFRTPSPSPIVLFGTSASFDSGLSPIDSIRTPSPSHHGLLGFNANLGNETAPMNNLRAPQHLINGDSDIDSHARSRLPVNALRTTSPVKPPTVKKQNTDLSAAIQKKKSQAKISHASMNVPADSTWSFGNADDRPPTRGKNKDDDKARMSSEEFVEMINEKLENWNPRNGNHERT